ncbi:MAG TPA: hypothetical protein VFU48_13935 [Nitrospira sp.]|nr:hypothetical protein [Nitrospira sp.]
MEFAPHGARKSPLDSSPWDARRYTPVPKFSQQSIKSPQQFVVGFLEFLTFGNTLFRLLNNVAGWLLGARNTLQRFF